MDLSIEMRESGDSIKDIFDGVKITYENFETDYIDKKYIDKIDIDFARAGEENDIECTLIILSFNELFFRGQQDTYKRFERRDIVYVDLVYSITKEVSEIIVPYKTDEDGFNRLQTLVIYPTGDNPGYSEVLTALMIGEEEGEW